MSHDHEHWGYRLPSGYESFVLYGSEEAAREAGGPDAEVFRVGPDVTTLPLR